MNDNVLFLICYIPTPVILLIAGLVMWRAPAPYGSTIGYRTRRSCSGAEAWDFSQVFWGRLMTLISIPVIAISAVAGVIQIRINADENTGLLIFCIVMAVQIIPIFITIPVTESELKKRFNNK